MALVKGDWEMFQDELVKHGEMKVARGLIRVDHFGIVGKWDEVRAKIMKHGVMMFDQMEKEIANVGRVGIEAGVVLHWIDLIH